MYKVLLVDDERIIREGIAAIIKWEEHGFSLIGAAQNGVEALEIIRRVSPEIVITDLKMPVLDGLELIAKVKSEFPETAFIVLSGFGEFELAKEAMYHGVRHYLLKPCNEAKIIEVLNEIKEEFIQKERKEQFIKENYRKEIGLDPIKANHEDIPTTNNKIIKKIVQYVRDNLGNEQLSLKYLAEQVFYMNDSYLSKLFIKETGEKFSHYLMRLRMEKAKELIAASDDDRIYEVALKVGLGNNPQYFSQLFKKYTGFAPSEYKRL